MKKRFFEKALNSYEKVYCEWKADKRNHAIPAIFKRKNAVCLANSRHVYEKCLHGNSAHLQHGTWYNAALSSVYGCMCLQWIKLNNEVSHGCRRRKWLVKCHIFVITNSFAHKKCIYHRASLISLILLFKFILSNILIEQRNFFLIEVYKYLPFLKYNA